MTPAEAIAALRGRARQSIPEITCELWIDPITAIEIRDDGKLVCEAPFQLFAWIERRYLKALGEFVREATDLSGIVLRRAVP